MERVNFEVDSALLSELGERLVGSVQVALMELVKNSYDADATEVTISINHVAGGVETRIDDNGVGMTFEQVKKYWMRIATTNKVENNISAIYGRPKSGAKGIGRFSCRRLGSKLRLQTSAKTENGAFETTEFIVDWTAFKPGTDLSRIAVNCERTVNTAGKSGTSLTITSTEESLFGKRNLDYIKRSCALLVANRGVARKGFSPDPGFDLSFKFFEDEASRPHNLRDDIFNAGWGMVTGVVEKNGTARFELKAMGIGVAKHTSSARFPMLAGAKLRIGVLVDDSSQLRDKSVLSKGVMREILSEWGGVFVRFNGMRIEPYGDKNDDWLNIDRDRGLRRGASEMDDIVCLAKSLKGIHPSRYLLNLLSSRSYVGDVEISSKMTGFELKASREGFLKNEAFEQLAVFARLAVDFITVYRDKFIQDEAERKLRETENALNKHVLSKQNLSLNDAQLGSVNDNGVRTLDYIRQIAKVIPEAATESKLRDVANDLSQATDYLEQRERRTDEELRRLRLVASSSVLLSLFAHDVKMYLGKMDDVVIRLKELAGGKQLGNAKELKEIAKEIQGHKDSFNRLVEMTLSVAVPTGAVEAEKLLVYDRLEMVVSCFRSLMADYGVVCDISKVPDDMYIGPLLVAELYSVFINVISNSIKAVIANRNGGPKKIEIVGETHNNHSKLIVRDTGIGVNLKKAADLFDPYVSDPERVLYASLDGNINKEHAFVLGTGSGLGLNIVKQIVQARQGKAEFVAPSAGWNTELVVEI